MAMYEYFYITARIIIIVIIIIVIIILLILCLGLNGRKEGKMNTEAVKTIHVFIFF